MTQAKERRILVVDDYSGPVQLLKKDLELYGFEVKSASEGTAALSTIQKTSPDLVILDLMLPGMGGFEVLERLRQFSNVPVIVLTARTEKEFILQGLEAGADDYLTKPFHFKELLVRIEAVLRRTEPRKVEQSREMLKIAGLDFDYANYRIGRQGKFKKLSPIEYQLLYCLLINEGKVVPYGELLAQVWGWGYSENENNLRVYIQRLRRLFEANSKTPRYIITVRGIGYMFVGEK